VAIFVTKSELRDACANLPSGSDAAAAAAAERQKRLTKPLRSLGKLEDLVVWLARWQGNSLPQLNRVDVLVFAGNHGVAASSAYLRQ
jgi:nicotinate-nucleotide--dimethylbenzimidazole phosphoribosyltransferase